MPTIKIKKRVSTLPRTYGFAAGVKKKVITMFRPQIRSRHPSHAPLRKLISRLPFRSIVRFGSSTELPDTITSGGSRIECNTVKSIKNSASKFLMKECFEKAKVRTAKWMKANAVLFVDDQYLRNYTRSTTITEAEKRQLCFPVVAKLNFGSRGEGMELLKSRAQYEAFLNTHRSVLGNYLLEEYHNYTREYRLHTTASNCFYTCRKMLREGAEQRWFRNDSNCVWIVETNPSFNKPSNWSDIENECIKALKAVGLDVGACDVRVAGNDNKFIIIEINSAPCHAEGTRNHYITEIPKILIAKKANYDHTNR